MPPYPPPSPSSSSSDARENDEDMTRSSPAAGAEVKHGEELGLRCRHPEAVSLTRAQRTSLTHEGARAQAAAADGSGRGASLGLRTSVTGNLTSPVQAHDIRLLPPPPLSRSHPVHFVRCSSVRVQGCAIETAISFEHSHDAVVMRIMRLSSPRCACGCLFPHVPPALRTLSALRARSRRRNSHSFQRESDSTQPRCRLLYFHSFPLHISCLLSLPRPPASFSHSTLRPTYEFVRLISVSGCVSLSVLPIAARPDAFAVLRLICPAASRPPCAS
ncbi:hypothetical protein DFH09DRAFT_1322347 [Mycena vulgaris]|nr:hypothetical protein DFH09DRAFT_1322347 [Mycena vulgaris]